MAFSFYKKPQTNDYYRNLKEEIIRELLRQVQYSYNLAFAVTAASALIIFCGVGLLYIDKVSEGTLTASGGVLGTLTSIQFAKDSKEELEEIMEKLLDES